MTRRGKHLRDRRNRVPAAACVTVLPNGRARRVSLGMTLLATVVGIVGSVPATTDPQLAEASWTKGGATSSVDRLDKELRRHVAAKPGGNRKPTASPSATAVPAPSPTVSPTTSPTPTASPTTSPTVSPTPAFSVPAGIPADCSRPVERELMNWIASVPDGSTLIFTANGCYGIDNSLWVQDRKNLTLNGNGSTFKALTTNNAHRAIWRIRGGSGITLTKMTARGVLNCADAISECAYPAKPINLEWQHGYTFEGTSDGTLDAVQAYNMWGDFVDVHHDDERICACEPEFGTPSKNIRVLNSRFERAGRQGIAITNVDGFLLQNSYIGEVNMAAIDMELDWSGATGHNVRIIGNQFGRHRFAMFSNGGQGTSESDVLIDGNRQVVGPVTCQPIVLSWGPVGARSNFRITNNNYGSYGEFVNFNGMTNAVIAGNTAVRVSGGGCGAAAVVLNDSRRISVTDNTFTGHNQVFHGVRNSELSEARNTF